MSEPIEAAARRWDTLARFASGLMAWRETLTCWREHGEYLAADDHSRRPCWKGWMGYREPYGEEWHYRPADEWCGPCRVRQTIHARYALIAKQRGAALRRLRQLLRVAL